MPRNGGTTFRMRRYNALPTATVPLGNSGITPPPVQLVALNIDAQMDFYGQYIVLNEQVTLNLGVVKSSLIDLEGYGESYADRAQAEPLALAA